MKKVLLDTNAYSHLLRGDKAVIETIASSDWIFMSIFVMGELYTGFKGGTKEQQNKHYLEKFLKQTSVQILTASQETSHIFAEVKHNLKKSGTPIPINDVWIAAHALETGAVLITYDAHFNRIVGLRLWDEI